MDKVILGLSGGVDSAVSARLIQKQGFEVMGLFLDIQGADAREDAERVAAFLGIHLKSLDISAALEENICAPFAAAYLRGETPNPCIMCNPKVKFKALCDYADEQGAKYVVTGHYAKSKDGCIYKGQPQNDQSYMLCMLKREQAARLLLPLGGFNKEQVRQMAEEMDLPVAHKPDSMEICFIPDKDYAGFISRRAESPPPGNFVFRGEVLGQHEGIHRYTVGQRRPGLFNEQKLYISEICPKTNDIVLSLWEDLFKNQIRTRNMNWLIDQPKNPLRASVKVRHTKLECPQCTVTPEGEDGAIIITDEAVRAPAPGQAAALYQGERLIGGGFII